ncbi:MAG: hypothetical protein OXC02_10210 [Rhodobacteraceae bacterium]|nr:hypothetical protein [Paracoccaceae bacterium]
MSSKDELTLDYSETNSVYRYVPVNQFAPLSDNNWLALGKVQSGEIDPENPWQFWLTVTAFNRSTKAAAGTFKVGVQIVSYLRNIYRIRFDPSVGTGNYQHKIFGPVTYANLATMRSNEIAENAPKSGLFNYSNGVLSFKTRDLSVSIEQNFKSTVTYKGAVIHQDADSSIENVGLGATFVDPSIGSAVATVKRNNKDDSSIKERFYGQGEVNVSNAGKSVSEGGYYVLGKTGLSMTNFNYDQITYVHPELAPVGYGQNTAIPDYYYPMYFSAPWIIAIGKAYTSSQYCYGIYLDNPSQSYVNTGDTIYGSNVGQSDKLYFGAQYGELDYYFVLGDVSTGRSGVLQVSEGLTYLTQVPSSNDKNSFKFAALPPKYIFGYFQGVYGAIGQSKTAYKNPCLAPDNATFFDEVLYGYLSVGVPLEGFAVDIDVQDTYNVFTTNPRFWLYGDTSRESIFGWAHECHLVTQTNVTCFIKDENPVGDVYSSLVSSKLYTKNNRADGGNFKTDGHGPSDSYCGQLSYGTNANITAIFPDWGKSGTAEWWGPNYNKLFGIGLDFVWQDMTTPSTQTHTIGNAVTDTDWPANHIYLDPNCANSRAPSADNIKAAESFNWRSYHMQALLTDPRYGDQKLRAFAELRNLHAYSLCSATYNEGILKTQAARTKFKRSYIIARGGQIGTHHFGGLWIGDNQTDTVQSGRGWDHLNLLIPQITSMNLSGLSICGADIGGFAQGDSQYNSSVGEGYPAEPQLLTRWVQAGFLLPWFRNHYDRWIDVDPSSSEKCSYWTPKLHGKPYQEIYNNAYNTVATGSKTFVEAMREAIIMRYRWQEILYTAAWQYSFNGTPIIKGICMWNGDLQVDYDARPELNSQFVLGGGDGFQIMAAPILTENQTQRKVYFPAGGVLGWYRFDPSYDDNDIVNYYGGGVDKIIDADFSTTPIFVQRGAILPTRYSYDGTVKSINSYKDSDPLVFDVFSAAKSPSGAAKVYIDDGGITTDAEETAAWSVLTCTNTQVTKTSVVFQIKYDQDFPHVEKFAGNIFLRLRAVGKVTSVIINSKEVEEVEAENKYQFFSKLPASNGYWLDNVSHSVWIGCVFNVDAWNIEIQCSDTVDRSTEIN